MPCYHPLIAVPDGITEKGKTHYGIIGEAKEPEFVKKEHPDAILLPCGRCTGCRLDRSRQWADRLLIELREQKKGVFITLTYEDSELPKTEKGHTTLKVKDTQDYMKRLREWCIDTKLRFFLCGEYGSPAKTFRPHYHQILFGLDLQDIKDRFGLRFYKLNNLGHPMYISDEFAEKVWRHGHCVFEEVTWENCAYTARYCTKKLNGELAKEIYEDRKPPFCVMSRRPGIAGTFFDRYNWNFDEMYIGTPHGQKVVKTPRYYLKKLEETDPELADILKAKRKEFIDDKRLLKLRETDLDFLSELRIEEEQKINRTKVLDRMDI